VPSEWIYLFVMAPLCIFKKTYPEKIYVAEVDCERPGEGKFLASLLKPEVTLWLNSGKTHTANFDNLVKAHKFKSVEEAVAYEFGHLLDNTDKLAIINGDDKLELAELVRYRGKRELVTDGELTAYSLDATGTEFTIGESRYRFKSILPRDSFYSIAMTLRLASYLGMVDNLSFTDFTLPAGRGGILRGIKDTRLIDSTYNATPDGMRATLQTFTSYPAERKWLVLGDMIELGEEEEGEHKLLAGLLQNVDADKIILVGRRVTRYTYPALLAYIDRPESVVCYEQPSEALEYIKSNIEGGEAVLFKGARFLEGIIEHLLKDKSDVAKLCRREEIWQTRRKKWNL